MYEETFLSCHNKRSAPLFFKKGGIRARGAVLCMSIQGKAKYRYKESKQDYELQSLREDGQNMDLIPRPGT